MSRNSDHIERESVEYFSTFAGIMTSDSQDTTMTISKIQLSVAAATGILLTATALKPQVPPVGPVWEYSSVTEPAAGRATICYASARGCRNDPVGNGFRPADDALM